MKEITTAKDVPNGKYYGVIKYDSRHYGGYLDPDDRAEYICHHYITLDKNEWVNYVKSLLLQGLRADKDFTAFEANTALIDVSVNLK